MSDPEHQEWKHMFGCKVKTPIDMPDDILRDAISVTVEHLDKEGATWESTGLETVNKIKKAMDAKWEPNWHVIIGNSFGCFATHETKRFLYFYRNDKAILMYKAG